MEKQKINFVGKEEMIVGKKTIVFGDQIRQKLAEIKGKIVELETRHKKLDNFNSTSEERKELRSQLKELYQFENFLLVKAIIDDAALERHEKGSMCWPEISQYNIEEIAGLKEYESIEIAGELYRFSYLWSAAEWEGYTIWQSSDSKPKYEWDSITLEEAYMQSRLRIAHNHVNYAIDRLWDGIHHNLTEEDLRLCNLLQYNQFEDLKKGKLIEICHDRDGYYFKKIKKCYPSSYNRSSWEGISDSAASLCFELMYNELSSKEKADLNFWTNHGRSYFR